MSFLESLESSNISSDLKSSNNSLIESFESSLSTSEVKDSNSDNQESQLAQSDYFATDSAIYHSNSTPSKMKPTNQESEEALFVSANKEKIESGVTLDSSDNANHGTVLGAPPSSMTSSQQSKKKNRKNKKKKAHSSANASKEVSSDEEEEHHTESENQKQESNDANNNNQNKPNKIARKTEPLPEQVALWDAEDEFSLEQRRERYSSSHYVTLDQFQKWSDEGKTLHPRLSEAEINSHYKFDNAVNSKIALYHGDITKLELDAVVNAANRGMLGGGGIDGAIHRAAGRQLYKECKLMHGCETGKAKITRGYDLPAKYVIHTVGPMDQDPDHLRSCYEKVLEIVDKFGLRSVAFCGISTGVYGYPLYPASRIALETIRKWLDTDNNKDKVDLIVVCTFTGNEKNCYENLMVEYFPLERSLEERGEYERSKREESERLEKETREREEREKQEREDKERVEKENREREEQQKKERDEKEKVEKETREREEREKKERETKEKAEKEEKERREREEKVKEEKEKVDRERREREEKEKKEEQERKQREAATATSTTTPVVETKVTTSTSTSTSVETPKSTPVTPHDTPTPHGDESGMGLWIGVGAAVGLVAAAAFFLSRRR